MDCMHSMLDRSLTLTESQETRTMGIETFTRQAEEQLHLLRGVDTLAMFPRGLLFYAFTGRALSRAKLGLLILSQSDIQEALHL